MSLTDILEKGSLIFRDVLLVSKVQSKDTQDNHYKLRAYCLLIHLSFFCCIDLNFNKFIRNRFCWNQKFIFHIQTLIMLPNQKYFQITTINLSSIPNSLKNGGRNTISS